MTPRQQRQVEQAIAQFTVFPDVDQLLVDYPVKIVAGALFSIYGTVRDTAYMMARADSTVRGHLMDLGIERTPGRPKLDTCHKGHDMAVYRKYQKGGVNPFCSECKRIRQRKG